MTREKAIQILRTRIVPIKNWQETHEAINMAIEALSKIESGRYVEGDCEHCARTFGTLSCCDTVNNEFVYSCEEGMTEYLESAPTGGDLISRQAAIDRIRGTGYADQIKENMVFLLHLLPSADRPTGEWIYNGPPDEWVLSLYQCDQCGHVEEGKQNFCPNCGAKMKGDV